jgi:thymidylate synthase (FAD)
MSDQDTGTPSSRSNPRIFHKPTVHLIAETKVNDVELEKWLDLRGFTFLSDAPSNADGLAENGGRLCYLSYNPDKRRHAGPGQNARYLDRTVREMGHGSITEHASFTFLIDDVSRNLTHELVRHRVGTAFSQASTRYIDQLESYLGWYVPPEIAAIPDLFARWLDGIEILAKLYQDSFDRLSAMGMEKKRARSLARHCLLGSAGTAIQFSVNVRELNHIFGLRGAGGADDEIRRLAVAMWEKVKWMNLFKHWQYDPVTGGLTCMAKEVEVALEHGLPVKFVNIEEHNGYPVLCDVTFLSDWGPWKQGTKVCQLYINDEEIEEYAEDGKVIQCSKFKLLPV